MKRLLFILSALFIASVAMAQTSREEIDAHPHIAMATHSVYAGGYFFKPLAEAPKGYKPFYISHYGRHGSRYEAEAEQTGDLLGIFRTAEKLGLLTAKGKEVLALAIWNDEHQRSCYVSWVEDNNNMVYIWAILLDVVTELSSDLAVTLEEVLTSHTLLTRSTT